MWRTEVASTSGTFDELVFVDAHTGTIALHFDQHAEAKSRRVCDRNNVPGGEACTSGFARVEGQAATGIADVDRAYNFSGHTYDFYFSKFARDSLDNAGLILRSTVRFCPDSFNCPFANAFWNGSQMVYGQGFASADDVVGHELTHGVTDFESDLYYFGQSGAINESLSDVFGEFVDLTNGAGHRHRRHALADGRGPARRRRHPRHGEPAGVRRPRSGREPDLLSTATTTTAACTPTAA